MVPLILGTWDGQTQGQATLLLVFLEGIVTGLGCPL